MLLVQILICLFRWGTRGVAERDLLLPRRLGPQSLLFGIRGLWRLGFLGFDWFQLDNLLLPSGGGVVDVERATEVVVVDRLYLDVDDHLLFLVVLHIRYHCLGREVLVVCFRRLLFCALIVLSLHVNNLVQLLKVVKHLLLQHDLSDLLLFDLLQPHLLLMLDQLLHVLPRKLPPPLR